MIISFKGLARCMNRALTERGYAISLTADDWLYIGAPDWCAAFQYDAMPRSMLGLIVSHIGDIPRQKDPLHLQKLERQVVKDHADMIHEGWLRALAGGKKTEEEITRTAISIGGLTVFQQEEPPGGCYLANTEHLDIVSAATPKGNRIVCPNAEGCMFRGKRSAAFIRFTQPEEDIDGERLTEILQRLTGTELGLDY